MTLKQLFDQVWLGVVGAALGLLVYMVLSTIGHFACQLEGDGQILPFCPMPENHNHTERSELNIEIDGKSYTCRLSDSSDDGSKAYLCQPTTAGR